MIIKTIISTNIASTCNYVFDGKTEVVTSVEEYQDIKQAEILVINGLREPTSSTDWAGRKALINGIKFQAELNLALKKCVQHTIISFSKNDSAKITKELMQNVVKDYIEKAGLSNTAYFGVSHDDKEHKHLHLIASRVDNNGKTISDQFIKMRDIERAQILARKYDLTPSLGEKKNRAVKSFIDFYRQKPKAKNLEETKTNALGNDQKAKYQIYQQLQSMLALSNLNWEELKRRLKEKEIEMRFFDNEKGERIGIGFIKDGFKFSGVQIDKSCSFNEINKQIVKNQEIQIAQKKSIKINNSNLNTINPLEISENEKQNPTKQSRGMSL